MTKTFFTTTLWIIILSSKLFAQTSTSENSNAISSWYLQERFLMADQNDDALLEKSELKAFSQEFSYFLQDRVFSIIDKNKDNYLSFNEMRPRVHSEFVYRYSMERKGLRRINSQHPMLAQVELDYYKSHPQLVKELFGNLVWMNENAKLAKKLYKDKTWTTRNPEVLIRLQHNLRWLAANPKAAKTLYKDHAITQRVPELLGWRSAHKSFIRQNPELDGIYAVSFFPQSMGLERR